MRPERCVKPPNDAGSWKFLWLVTLLCEASPTCRRPEPPSSPTAGGLFTSQSRTSVTWVLHGEPRVSEAVLLSFLLLWLLRLILTAVCASLLSTGE